MQSSLAGWEAQSKKMLHYCCHISNSKYFAEVHKQCTSLRCCSFPYNEEIHHQKGKFSAQHSDVNSLISLKEVLSFIFESHTVSVWMNLPLKHLNLAGGDDYVGPSFPLPVNNKSEGREASCLRTFCSWYVPTSASH